MFNQKIFSTKNRLTVDDIQYIIYNKNFFSTDRFLTVDDTLIYELFR